MQRQALLFALATAPVPPDSADKEISVQVEGAG
jgi:hypothetical protein